MKNKSAKTVVGLVEEALPATNFRIRTEEGRKILAHLSGKMRIHHIRIIPGDRVIVEFSPYDDNRGRIIRRL